MFGFILLIHWASRSWILCHPCLDTKYIFIPSISLDCLYCNFDWWRLYINIFYYHLIFMKIMSYTYPKRFLIPIVFKPTNRRTYFLGTSIIYPSLPSCNWYWNSEPDVKARNWKHPFVWSLLSNVDWYSIFLLF